MHYSSTLGLQKSRISEIAMGPIHKNCAFSMTNRSLRTWYGNAHLSSYTDALLVSNPCTKLTFSTLCIIPGCNCNQTLRCPKQSKHTEFATPCVQVPRACTCRMYMEPCVDYEGFVSGQPVEASAAASCCWRAFWRSRVFLLGRLGKSCG